MIYKMMLPLVYGGNARVIKKRSDFQDYRAIAMIKGMYVISREIFRVIGYNRKFLLSKMHTQVDAV